MSNFMSRPAKPGVYPKEIMVIFGVVGYLMKKVRFEGASLLLGMVLGLMMEDALRQSLIMCRKRIYKPWPRGCQSELFGNLTDKSTSRKRVFSC
jgi:TctA family transporter